MIAVTHQSCLTTQQGLQTAKQQLQGVAAQPLFEAEILLAFAWQVSRSDLYAWPDKAIPDAVLASFYHVIERRRHKEPIAYITGTREFWSLDFDVNAHTLIPRPETELLIEKMLDLFSSAQTNLRVADLGTGCGCIALTLAHERPAWQLYATDKSEKALQVARKNAKRLNISNLSFLQGHWCDVLSQQPDFDAIISNPPYIAEKEWPKHADGLLYEPRQALVSGEDGLHAIREIIQTAKDYLKPGGYLLIEHGYRQAQLVRGLFAASGYSKIQSVQDLSGLERVTMGLFGF